MTSSTKNAAKSVRDSAYYRKRYQNRVFAGLVDFVTKEAQSAQLTKKDIAERMNKDAGYLSRLLSQPSNLTLDTITDLLLAFDAEAEPPQIIKFSDRTAPNYIHPLIARAVHADGIKPPTQNKIVTKSKVDKPLEIHGNGFRTKSSSDRKIELVIAE